MFGLFSSTPKKKILSFSEFCKAEGIELPKSKKSKKKSKQISSDFDPSLFAINYLS